MDSSQNDEVNRFPRLHSAYLFCRGVHVKDGIELIVIVALALFAFSSVSLLLSPPSTATQFFLKFSFLLLDLLAILSLLLSYIRESHEFLLPFIFFQGLYSAWMFIGSIFCFLIPTKLAIADPFLLLPDQPSIGFPSHSQHQQKVLVYSSGLILLFSSFISLSWTYVAIRCFHYFRDLATFNTTNYGQNEFVESAISRKWTCQ